MIDDLSKSSFERLIMCRSQTAAGWLRKVMGNGKGMDVEFSLNWVTKGERALVRGKGSQTRMYFKDYWVYFTEWRERCSEEGKVKDRAKKVGGDKWKSKVWHSEYYLKNQWPQRKKGKERLQSDAGEDNFVDRGLESQWVLDSPSVSCENYNNI